MKSFNSIGEEEKSAASLVIKKAVLSSYIGNVAFGGPKILELEHDWQNVFKIRHAVAVNSGTSGLLAACMAIGIGLGDEVIVSPYTMSATAAAPKILGAKIVWADIEPEQFTIDPVEVTNKITRRTRAVIVTNLFGHPAHLHQLREICDNKGIYLIEDNAQAIFASENDKYAGTIGHIGVFSLNVHKHLQVGEGGVVVTTSDKLAINLRAAMNHGEVRGRILGLNLRMTEVTAAMAVEQLKKAPQIMASRVALGHKISAYVNTKPYGYKGLHAPTIRQDCQHAFYAWGGQMLTHPRNPIPKPFRAGYLKPLYRLGAFNAKTMAPLPIVEAIEKRIVLFEVCAYDPTDSEIERMVNDLWAAI